MRKEINAWLDDEDRPLGTNTQNLIRLRAIKQLSKLLGRNSAVAYFLICEYGMKELHTLLVSCTKQRRLCEAVIVDLKKYIVEPEWRPAFDLFEDNIEKRANHCFRIIQEVIRLTELHPYFSEVGYEDLLDFTKRTIGDNSRDQMLKEAIAKYAEENPEKIAAYMRSIEHEIRARDERIARRRQEAEDEKAAKKRAKEMAKEEAEEIRKNEEAHRKRARQIERSFERYYK